MVNLVVCLFIPDKTKFPSHAGLPGLPGLAGLSGLAGLAGIAGHDGITGLSDLYNFPNRYDWAWMILRL